MARILAISSQVARGHVGLSIIVPALEALGHDVIAMPTILLSNQPGHTHVAGTQIEPAVLVAMLDAIEANGWLDRTDAILTGYLPTVAHVQFAVDAVNRVRARNPLGAPIYLCDPVLGDDPNGLYIAADAAAAIRDTLIGKADVLTPNRFELEFLSSRSISNAADAHAALQSVQKLSRQTPAGQTVVATSIPAPIAGETMNVLSTLTDCAVTRVAVRANVPHGTGDLFSALFLAARVTGQSPNDALAAATAGVDQTLADSDGCDNLQAAKHPAHSARPTYWPIDAMPL